jgi:nicotinamidase-related amidase
VPETALIVIDMLNPYDHEDAEPLAESARATVAQMAELRDRAAAAPEDEAMLVYVNDNYEHWERTRDDLVRCALEGRHPELVEPIVPPADVPFLVKGRHSIFYQTSVDHLLQVAGVKRLVLCGQVTEQCIQYSALDAYMRGYEVHVPRDAVAHIVPEWAEAALGMMAENMHAELETMTGGLMTVFR